MLRKLNKLVQATNALNQATATLKQAEGDLLNAQTAANQASDDLKKKKKAEQTAQINLGCF